MRMGTITAKTKSGEWVTLAQPDVPLNEQKEFFKQLKAENGQGILLGNERVDLAEAHLFVSGAGKRVRFKEPGASVVGNGEAMKFARNLNDLAAELELERDALDALRKLEGFPIREKSGYDVAATRAFVEAQSGDGKPEDDEPQADGAGAED